MKNETFFSLKCNCRTIKNDLWLMPFVWWFFSIWIRMIERIAWAKTSFFFKLYVTMHRSCESSAVVVLFCASHLHRATIRFNINFNEYELCEVNCNYNYNCVTLSHQIHLFDLQRTVLFIAVHLWRYAFTDKKCTLTHTSLKWPQVLKIRLGVNVEWVFVWIDKSFWCCDTIVRCQRNNCYCTFSSRKQTVKWNI